MRSFKTYLNILRTKGLRYCFNETWPKVLRVHYIDDDAQLRTQWVNHYYNIFKRRYRKTALQVSGKYAGVVAPNPYPYAAWVLWLQGEQNAPLMVQHCIASIRKNYTWGGGKRTD